MIKIKRIVINSEQLEVPNERELENVRKLLRQLLKVEHSEIMLMYEERETLIKV